MRQEDLLDGTVGLELARFLDLEVILAPRQAAPAIDAIIRGAAAARVSAQVARDLDRIGAAARDMRQRGEDVLAVAPTLFHQIVQRLAETAAPLALAGASFAAPFAARELSRIANQVAAAQKLVTPAAGARAGFTRRNPKTIEQAERRLAEATRALVALRNSVARRASEEQRPAYALDDEEGHIPLTRPHSRRLYPRARMSAPTHPANRLAHEKSPYLLQHAHNPVDWYPWGEEAFARARREDKPIFLSIGYSTCHRCHVMERESFEDEHVAERLRADFVAIKVDREERPDVDRIYMTATQLMTRSGGWPNSLFLTPDLKPFFGGTYFPPRDVQGRPGFARVLQSVRQS